MPGLQSFCVCTALALGAIYLLQITWFVAWMSLDEKRIATDRNGCLPCIVHKTLQKSSDAREDCENFIVQKYNKLLYSIIYKISVAIATLGFMSFGIWGCCNISEHFDFMLLLPEDSYLRQWHSVKEDLYPDRGWTAEIFTGGFNHSDLSKFENLTRSLNELENSERYIKSK